MQKTIFFILTAFFVLISNANASNEDIVSQANQVLKQCSENIQEVETSNSLQGNIEDVMRERQIRKCLKKKTVEIAASILIDQEIENFEKALTDIETSSFNTYKLLIFCSNEIDKFWCEQQFNDDTSLGRLLLERKINEQMLNILISTLDSRQGGFDF